MIGLHCLRLGDLMLIVSQSEAKKKERRGEEQWIHSRFLDVIGRHISPHSQHLVVVHHDEEGKWENPGIPKT